MAKKIGVTMSLKNDMSTSLLKIKDDVKGVSDELQKAAKKSVSAINRMKSSFEHAGDKLLKTSAGIASVFAGMALKTGFSEAVGLEGYRTQLETATKDTKRAAEVMRYSMKMADITPFEGGELVAAASGLEMAGLKTERWLPVLGDAAAGAGRAITDVQKGFQKALTTGQFEGLQDTLLINKDMVNEYAKLNFGKSFANASGQVTDMELLQKSLEGLLLDRYGGGMEKLAHTTKGAWSTITGNIKSALANIIGMTSAGEIRVGSMLEKLREAALSAADTLTRWQEDGTLEKISDDVSKAFTLIYNTAVNFASFAQKYQGFIKFSAGLAVVAYGMVKLQRGVKAVQGAFTGGFQTFVTLAKNFKQLKSMISFTANFKLTLIIAAVLALAAAAYVVYKNWDKISAGIKEFGASVKGFFSDVGTSIKTTMQPAVDCIQWLIDGANKIGAALDSITGKLPKGTPVTDYAMNQPVPIRGFALGTQYAPGGFAKVNERGGEIINLPRGSKVIPADKSKRMMNSPGVLVKLTIQGNVIGNREFVDYIGNTIAERVTAALGSM